MLKQDTSEVNDLSAFSYKAKNSGHRDISILYAYDIESMEPICAEVFPGNSIDASSYSAFIRDNDIKKGIIVADKGFPPNAIKNELKDRPELHFMTPIKRNDVRIGSNNMLNFEGVLIGVGEKKKKKKQT
jgi:transposase